MMREMISAFDLVDADDDVRAVIVTGAGRAFCAGADLSAAATRSPAAGSDVDDAGRRATRRRRLLTLRIFECTKPVIGAINGAAVGVGVTMTLPMDIRLASTTARFGFVFARRGIVPEARFELVPATLVGISRAAEWCYTGRIFAPRRRSTAASCAACTSPTTCCRRRTALAAEIADNTAPVSVALTRQMMWRMLGADHPMEAHRADSRAILRAGSERRRPRRGHELPREAAGGVHRPGQRRPS